MSIKTNCPDDLPSPWESNYHIEKNTDLIYTNNNKKLHTQSSNPESQDFQILHHELYNICPEKDNQTYKTKRHDEPSILRLNESKPNMS